MHWIDSESPQSLKDSMIKDLAFQLVLPNIHRRDLVEQAISTFKDHVLVDLAIIDSTPPTNLRYRLLSRATMTMKIIRQSKIYLSSGV